MKPSFSLKWLFVSIAVVGLTITGLINANQWWAYAMSTTILASLFYAPLCVAVRGRKEPFWLGFAVAGWLWLLLAGYTTIGTPSENSAMPLEPILHFMQERLPPLPQYPSPPEVDAFNNRQGLQHEMFEFVTVGAAAALGGIVTYVLSHRNTGS